MHRSAEERDAERRAVRANIPYANLSKAPISIEAIKLIEEKEAREVKIAAIELRNKEVAIAALNPNSPAVDSVITRLRNNHYQVRAFLCSLSSLEQAWGMYKFIANDTNEITGKVAIEKTHFESLLKSLTTLESIKSELERVLSEHVTTTVLLETVLAGALNTRTSDVHFEAEDGGTRTRFRIDGSLHDILEAMPMKSYDSLVTRIKLLSGLKMNVHGEPQDGRFTINLPTKEIEMRVSIIPSEFGETIVMRVLDPDSIKVTLDDLGLRPDDRAIVDKEISKPNGLILNTGPTGSGKTTTLYAFLQKIYNSEIKIITIEDPIEYRIKGVEQTQVNPEVGYTFANGLRAVLRQDPDAVLVGEIRDKETADIAVQAALTGHLVLSTLHTNDAVGAVPRLIDLDIKPMMIGPSVSLIIAQRLVRKLCVCKKELEISADLKEKIKNYIERLPKRVKRENYQEIKMFKPSGCEKCANMGYRGRVGVFEFFEANEDFQGLILKQDLSEIVLKEAAKRQGMVSMQEDGVLKAISGITSLEEVEDATGPISW